MNDKMKAFYLVCFGDLRMFYKANDYSMAFDSYKVIQGYTKALEHVGVINADVSKKIITIARRMAIYGHYIKPDKVA